MMGRFQFKEAGAALWPAFEKLFGENGACGGCWCQYWRVPKGGKTWEAAKYDMARKAMKHLFLTNRVTGLLAFDGDRAVGWCSFGPRRDFPRIENMKAYRRDDTDGVWSINCFFIDKNYRRRGLAREMLRAALKFIKKKKVRVVEAYPTPLSRNGNKLPPAFSWTGPMKIFEEAGFEIIQRLSYSRPLARKKL